MDARALKKKLDFIDSYKAAKNASTGSLYDSNANVTQKNIATLQCELGKKDLIDVNRALMCRYIEKRYGPDVAKSYMNDLSKHVIYRNDESSVMPYTYSATEVVNVRYRGQELLLSLEDLYDLADCEEALLDDEEGVWAKYPKGMEIRDNGGYTEVQRLIKKVRHRPLVRVKTQFGEDLVVTDNHPLIVNDDISQTVEASKAAGLRQFRPEYSLVWKDCREIDLASLLDSSARESAGDYFTSQTQGANGRVFLNYKKVVLTDELGYLVGFFLGDGNFHQISGDDGLRLARDTIAISQNNKECLLRLAEIAAKYFMAPFAIYDVGRGEREAYRLVIKSDGLVAFLYDYLKLGTYAQNKSLPYNILETNRDFAKGIIWGLVDSDGSRNRYLFDIRLSSRTAINQLLWVMRDLGYNVGSRKQIMQFGFEGVKIQQRCPVWGVSFSITDPEKQGFPLSYKWQSYLEERRQTGKHKTFTKYHTGWETISEVTDIPESKFLEQNAFIYDITTESHSFVCNNLWVHNCASISLYPFLLHGLTTLGGSSKPPTHANSFIGGMINLIFMVSAQFAGAVAVPEFFAYFDHFLRIDYGEDYIEHLSDAVERCNGREFTLKHKIEDWFQQFVYSINQPAGARNYQSPFVNVGYFDRYYFESVFEDFVFPDGDEPRWETAKELQKMFMKWFNKERERAVLTFPVESFSLLVDKETGRYKDEESAQFVSEMWAEGHSFFCYQSDSADALASCCFDRGQMVRIRVNGEKHIVSFGQAESLISNQDNGLEIWDRGHWRKGRLIKLPTRPMYLITSTDGRELRASDNHIHLLSDNSEKHTAELMAGDSLATYDSPEFVVKSIDRYTYDGSIYCFEMEDGSNPYFTLENGVVTHNCRLRNAIEDNVFSYTLGAGAIQTGSKCVITMNVNHVVQDWDRDGRPGSLSDRIAEVGKRIHKYLTAWNDKLWDDYEAGMLPVYKAGFIDLDKQYLTIGVNGFLEGAEFLGISIDPDSPEYKGYAKDILGTLKEINKEDRWRSGDGFEFDLNGRHYVMSADDRVRLVGGGFVKCSEWLKSPESYDVVGLDAFSPCEIREISEISAKEE